MSYSIKDFLKGQGIENAELKKKFFSLLVDLGLCSTAFYLILSLILKKDTYCLLVYVAMFLFLMVLYFIGKFNDTVFMQKRLYFVYCFFMGNVFLPSLYLLGGGIHSGLPLFFMVAGITTILMLDNLLMVIMLLLNFISSMAAFKIDQTHPGLVDSFTQLGDATYIDIGISSIIAGIGIGFFLRHLTKYFDKNQRKASELLNKIEDASKKDPLCGAYNRRYLMEFLGGCIEKVEKGEMETFSIIMFDIDHFKKINDTYGHLTGDDCIKSLTYIFKRSVRNIDIVCRYGGEEFICVLPTAEDTPAFRRAEQIRASVENTQLSTEIDKKVTISGGVAMYRPGMTPEELIKEADSNLYLAKENGRNQIVWHNGGIPPLCYATYSSDILNPVQNSGRRFSDVTT